MNHYQKSFLELNERATASGFRKTHLAHVLIELSVYFCMAPTIRS